MSYHCVNFHQTRARICVTIEPFVARFDEENIKMTSTVRLT